MARLGGRNMWIAAPAALLCAAVIAGLAWLAVPMVPVAVDWAGQTLRNTTDPAAMPERERKPSGADAADCRGLYPDVLWSALMWHGSSRLDQSTAPPATAVTGVTEALTPTVRLTCRWIYADAEIISTLAEVAPESVAVAEAGLRGQGFTCESTDGGLTCARQRGPVTEEHALRGGLWIATVARGWHPEDYGALLSRHVLG